MALCSINSAETKPLLWHRLRMFSEAGVSHHVAHFHAYFQDEAGVFSIRPVDMIAGTLPQKQQRLVEAWGELH